MIPGKRRVSRERAIHSPLSEAALPKCARAIPSRHVIKLRVRKQDAQARLPPHELSQPSEPSPSLDLPRRHADLHHLKSRLAVAMEDRDFDAGLLLHFDARLTISLGI